MDRATRLFEFPSGIVIQTADHKELKLSRKAGQISELIRTSVNENTEANEETFSLDPVTGQKVNWDEKKLQTEPLLEVSIDVITNYEETKDVIDYLNHFNGDDSTASLENQWEQKFIQGIAAKGMEFLVKVLYAADYFGVISLAKLICKYIKSQTENLRTEIIASKNGPLQLKEEILRASDYRIITSDGYQSQITALDLKYSKGFSVVLFADGHYFTTTYHFKSDKDLLRTAINFPNKVKCLIKSKETLDITCEATSDQKLFLTTSRIKNAEDQLYCFGWITSSSSSDSISNYAGIIPPPNRIDIDNLELPKNPIHNMEFYEKFQKEVAETKDVKPPKMVYLRHQKYTLPKLSKSMEVYAKSFRDKTLIEALLSFHDFIPNYIPMCISTYTPSEPQYIPEHIFKTTPYYFANHQIKTITSVGKYIVVIREFNEIKNNIITLGDLFESTPPYHHWILTSHILQDINEYEDDMFEPVYIIKIDENSFLMQGFEDFIIYYWNLQDLDTKQETFQTRFNIFPDEGDRLAAFSPEKIFIQGGRNLFAYSTTDGTEIEKELQNEDDEDEYNETEVDEKRKIVIIAFTRSIDDEKSEDYVREFDYNLQELKVTPEENKRALDFLTAVNPEKQEPTDYIYDRESKSPQQTQDIISVTDRKSNIITKYVVSSMNLYITYQEPIFFRRGFVIVLGNKSPFPDKYKLFKYSMKDNLMTYLGCPGILCEYVKKTQKLFILSGYSGYPEIWF